MPQKDSTHELVKLALIKNGWEITNDPYVMSYGERFLFVDLGATKIALRFMRAQRTCEVKQWIQTDIGQQ